MPTSSSSCRQFRNAGPMLLSSPTQQDLDDLRQVIARSAPIIQYLAFYQAEEPGVLHVYAHAKNKLSPACWRGAIHRRLQDIVPSEDMKTILTEIKSKPNFEQFGSFKRRSVVLGSARASKAGQVVVPCPPVVKCKATANVATQTDPVDLSAPRPLTPCEQKYIDRLIGHIKPRDGYATVRKLTWRSMGYNVPDDYDLDPECARKYHEELAHMPVPEDAKMIPYPLGTALTKSSKKVADAAVEIAPASITIKKKSSKLVVKGRPQLKKKFVRTFKYRDTTPPEHKRPEDPVEAFKQLIPLADD